MTKIKDMTKEELREYKRIKAIKYNDKPKITCEICESKIKPCSKKAHEKTNFHKMTITLKNVTDMYGSTK